MKKRFVPRAAVKEKGHSDLHKFPLQVISRNDYIANVNPGEKFWFHGGDVMTLESISALNGIYRGDGLQVYRVKYYDQSGKKFDRTHPHIDCAVMCKATHVFRIKSSGELLSGAPWSSFVRSGIIPLESGNLMIVNNIMGTERLLRYSDLTSGSFELYRVL